MPQIVTVLEIIIEIDTIKSHTQMLELWPL